MSGITTRRWTGGSQKSAEEPAVFRKAPQTQAAAALFIQPDLNKERRLLLIVANPHVRNNSPQLLFKERQTGIRLAVKHVYRQNWAADIGAFSDYWL